MNPFQHPHRAVQMPEQARSNWIDIEPTPPRYTQMPKADIHAEQMDFTRELDANRSHDNKSAGEKFAVVVSVIVTVGLVLALALGWLP